MTVELWYGDKPRHPGEQDALIDLYQFLLPQEEHFVLLLNFTAPQTNEIDLVVLKEQGIFLTELKRASGKLVGGPEGDWKIIDPDGSEVALNPGRPNPFKQIRYNYWHFKEWFEANREAISTGIVRAQPVDFNKMTSLVVIYPELHPESQLKIGRGPVQVMGFSKFLPTLVMRASQKIGLSRQEMCRIPQLLDLKGWRLMPHDTARLDGDWQPPAFAVLVARGHDLSVPLFDLQSVDKEVITVGRDADNDLVIADPAVSRHHAEIRHAGGRYVVCDLRSANGTFVCFSGEPAQERDISGAENALKNNSLVRFGPAGFTLLLNE